jgi:hypothetical protein
MIGRAAGARWRRYYKTFYALRIIKTSRVILDKQSDFRTGKPFSANVVIPITTFALGFTSGLHVRDMFTGRYLGLSRKRYHVNFVIE